ncbi:MAG: hypothetical protein ABSG25_12885 [Bryobacteraceae bacterium]
MATNVPPMTPPGGAAPPKKTNPLVWILVGIAGFIFLMVLLVVAGGLIFVHKIHQAGFDSNPAAAVVRMAIAANPDLELITVDEKSGVVIVRDKKKGETVKLNFDDVKKGRFSVEGANGEKFSVGAGSAVKLPGWFPSYPGSNPEGSYSAQDAQGQAGVVQFSTKDPAAQVMSFYESGLGQAGLKVTRVMTGEASILAGNTENGDRNASVTVISANGTTKVTITFKSKS